MPVRELEVVFVALPRWRKIETGVSGECTKLSCLYSVPAGQLLAEPEKSPIQLKIDFLRQDLHLLSKPLHSTENFSA